MPSEKETIKTGILYYRMVGLSAIQILGYKLCNLKKLKNLGPREIVVFEDETRCTLHPRLGQGWAKKAKTYRIPTTNQHKKWLNPAGKVAPLLGRYGFIRIDRGDRKSIMKVLHHLYKKLRRYTIWLYVDGAHWHKGEPVDRFIKTHKRIHLEYLPSYQPGLNMQERI